MALSRFDIPDGYELMVSSCEDCACAVSDGGAGRQAMPSAPADLDDGRWVRSGEVTEFPLGGEHRILFNPLGSGGVVVVNERPTTSSVPSRCPPPSPTSGAGRPGQGAEVTEIFRRLRQLQLIHADGQRAAATVPPRPGTYRVAARD